MPLGKCISDGENLSEVCVGTSDLV